MKYRLGFDIGIKSVGWAVVENDLITEEPMRIADLGVRTFDANEVDKTGESTAKSRREFRSNRRRRRRKAFRFERMIKLLTNAFKIDLSSELEKIKNKDVYELRARALDEKVDDGELCKIILNLLKRRGFKSNRKEFVSTKEEGKLKKAIEENKKFLEEHSYRTIGEAVFKSDRFKINCNGKLIYNVRNHGDYKNCFYRSDLQNELELILKEQSQFNENISAELIKKVVGIFSAQRNFDEGPGDNSPYKAKFQVGNCTFIKTELRAPKSSYTFELFSALSKLNSLRINNEELSSEQHEILLDKVKKSSNIKFFQIRKWLALNNDQTFNLCNYYIKPKDDEILTSEKVIEKAEAKEFVKFDATNKIKKALNIEDVESNKELLNEVALLLSMCKSDSTIDEWIKNNEILKALSSEQISKVKTLNFDKFGNLSIKAMEQIIPYLIKGERYDQACKSAGFNHSQNNFEKQKFLTDEKVAECLNDITVPTVKRAVNQTIRILNDIIKKYGSPQFVTVELARDFERTPGERRIIENQQNERYLENKKYGEEIIQKYKAIVTGNDIVKLRLYNEQNCKCMYSGETIDIDKLFSGNYYQVDHALPISRSLDDSYNNKVLVKTSENQLKGNMTPYEYFKMHKTEDDWNNYVARVNSLNNMKKRRLLLTEKYEKKEKDFIERNSNDTRYISRTVLNLLQDYLLTEPNTKGYKKVIKCISGGVTAYLRKCWGINKIREDGDAHHCVDAAVIAVATDGEVQKITEFNKYKEKFVQKGDKLVAVSTGEVVDLTQKEQIRNEEIQNIGKLLPKPYENFTKELELRSRVKYDGSGYTEQEQKQLLDFGYLSEEVESARPLFVSRMKSVKETGAIHKDTMYSTKLLEKTGMLVKTVPLCALKLANKPEAIPLKGDLYPNYSIDGYLKPNDDRKFYLMLKQMLYKDKDVFKNTVIVNKPGKNGKQGMPVRNVKIMEYNSNPALINGGAFGNDKMYRIDLFKKNGKYYIVPVYMKDVYAHKLPNKVIAIGKPWIKLDDSYEFQFSLYQNDLIKIEWNKEAKLSKLKENTKSNKPDEINLKSGLFYYNGCGISSANIKILTCDRCYSIESLGVQNLANITKCYVDIMGKVYHAPKETRKEL